MNGWQGSHANRGDPIEFSEIGEDRQARVVVCIRRCNEKTEGFLILILRCNGGLLRANANAGGNVSVRFDVEEWLSKRRYTRVIRKNYLAKSGFWKEETKLGTRP